MQQQIGQWRDRRVLADSRPSLDFKKNQFYPTSQKRPTEESLLPERGSPLVEIALECRVDAFKFLSCSSISV